MKKAKATVDSISILRRELTAAILRERARDPQGAEMLRRAREGQFNAAR